MLHELRALLGEKVFFDGLRDYYQSRRSGTASTEDLRASLEKVSGQDLRDFFERWVYESGHPVYSVSWTQDGAGMIELKLTQMQPEAAFLIPVTLEVVTAGGAKRVHMTPKGREEKINPS